LLSERRGCAREQWVDMVFLAPILMYKYKINVGIIFQDKQSLTSFESGVLSAGKKGRIRTPLAGIGLDEFECHKKHAHGIVQGHPLLLVESEKSRLKYFIIATQHETTMSLYNLVD
jgi:hypothetical protein